MPRERVMQRNRISRSSNIHVAVCTSLARPPSSTFSTGWLVLRGRAPFRARYRRFMRVIAIHGGDLRNAVTYFDETLHPGKWMLFTAIFAGIEDEQLLPTIEGGCCGHTSSRGMYTLESHRGSKCKRYLQLDNG